MGRTLLERMVSDGPLAKAVRIVLVFTLVFWASFNVECLAFAASNITGADDAAAHEGQLLSDLQVWEASAEDTSYIPGTEPVRTAQETAQGAQQVKDLAVSADSGTLYFAALPVWVDGGVQPEQPEQPEAGGDEGGSGGSSPETPSAGDDTGNTGNTDDNTSGGDTPGDESSGEATGTGDESAETTGDDSQGGDVAQEDGNQEGNSEIAGESANSGASTVGGESEAGQEGAVGAQSETTTRPAPAPQAEDATPEDVTNVTAATFVKWTVSDPELAAIEAVPGGNGVVALTGRGNKSGQVTVTCELDGDAFAGQLAPEFTGEHKVEFTVNVKAPYVGVLIVHRPPAGEGEACGEDVTLTDEECKSYALWAEVKMSNYEGTEQTTVPDTATKRLSEASGGRFQDLEWSVEDAEGNKIEDAAIASITQDGTLSFDKEKGPVTVVCTTPDGIDGKPYSVRVRVSAASQQEEEADDPAARQGESHPQDTLTVVVERPGTQAASSEESDESASSNSGEAADANGGASEGSENVDAQAESDEAEGGDAEAASSESAASEASEAASSGSAASAEPATTEKVYTPDDLRNIGESLEAAGTPISGAFGEERYSLVVGGEAQTITARGVHWSALLLDVGVSEEEQQNIDSIEFVNYRDVSKTVLWSDVVTETHTEKSYPMVAVETYVHAPDEGQGAQEGKQQEGGVSGDASDETSGEDNGENAGEETGQEDGGQSRGSDVGTQAEEGADEGQGAQENTSDADGGGASQDGADAASGTDTDGTAGTDGNAGANAAGDGSSGGEAQAGDAAQENSTGAGQTFYDNTRFQFLFDGSYGTLDDGAELRWVNKIIVHMKGEEAAPEDPYLKVHISYVPVPKGRTAFLSAVPNQAIGTARFGFVWERSTDEGKTWTEVASDSIQTLRVDTDDEHIGNQYRVTLETDLTDEDTGEARKARSDVVTIKEGSGLVLDYTPPLAGEVAEFVSHWELADDTIDTSSAEYIWEQSIDGGATWSPIEFAASSPTLRVPTNPIDPNAESKAADDSSDDASQDTPPVTYIRVRAIVEGQENPFESNWCPLTVRVPDASSKDVFDDIGNKAKELEDSLNSNAQNVSDNFGDIGDVTPDDFANVQERQPTSQKQITEIETPTVEYSPSSMADYLVDEEEEPVGDTGDIVVNDRVSEQIRQQEQQAQQVAEQTVPGQRWTELSTMNPSNEDLQRIFADNPFAPFALPLSLGVAFAGGLEKLLAFRRQL